MFRAPMHAGSKSVLLAGTIMALVLLGGCSSGASGNKSNIAKLIKPPDGFVQLSFEEPRDAHEEQVCACIHAVYYGADKKWDEKGVYEFYQQRLTGNGFHVEAYNMSVTGAKSGLGSVHVDIVTARSGDVDGVPSGSIKLTVSADWFLR